MEREGLLVVDKPHGMTSFDVIRRLRRVLGTRAIGHTGTLDPAATGVLCLCFGWSRKLIRFLDDDHKLYRGVCHLGVVTDTSDADGRILAEHPVFTTAERIRSALDLFTGTITQRPSAFSAIKTDGERAYVRSRRGEAVCLPARPVRIDSIELESVDLPRFTFRVSCGKGTYIRSLCRDIGESLGCGAHLAELRRLEDGRFRLDHASTLSEVDQQLEETGGVSLVSSSEMLVHLPVLALSPDACRALGQGQRPELPEALECPPGTLVRVTAIGSHELLAIAEVVASGAGQMRLRPVRVRPSLAPR